MILTRELIKEANIKYDEKTGLFTKNNKESNSDRIRLKNNGSKLSVARIIWVIKYGSEPDFKLEYKDGNHMNRMIDNIQKVSPYRYSNMELIDLPDNAIDEHGILDHKYVVEYMSYNKETGIFKRRKTTIKDGRKMSEIPEIGDSISLFGRSYKRNILAVYMVTGKYPITTIEYIDGDKNNNRYNNLDQSSTKKTNKNRISKTNEKTIDGVTYRECTICNEYKEKNNDNFMFKSDTGSLTAECRECNKRKKVEFNKTEYGVYLKRKGSLKKRGITPEEYDEILKEQDYKCAICGTKNPSGRASKISGLTNFSVDHDHATGNTRGLLCSNCNTGIGLLGDNIEIMKSAIEYLINVGAYNKRELEK